MRRSCVCGYCGIAFVANVVKGAHRGKYCSLKCYRANKIGKPNGMAAERPSYLIYGGYKWVRIPFDCPGRLKKGMRGAKYIQEHVLVAENALGRPMKSGEVVHHINLDKLDNRKVNLLICSKAYHRWLHARMEQAWAKEHLVRNLEIA